MCNIKKVKPFSKSKAKLGQWAKSAHSATQNMDTSERVTKPSKGNPDGDKAANNYWDE